MIKLKCVNGWHRKLKRECAYEIVYGDHCLRELQEQKQKNGGWNCPACGTFTLKTFRSK